MVFDSGRPIAHVARDLGIHPETLRKWVRKAEADARIRKDLLSTEEREELKTLRGEVRELRRANDILKSASAYYQRAKGERSRTSACSPASARSMSATTAPDEAGRDPGRQAARQALAHDNAGPLSAAPPRPGAARLHCTRPRPPLGRGFIYLRSWEGVTYFAFAIDAFSRKVIGWQLASHMPTDLVLDALRMGLGQREPGADFELVAHTDRGSQYTSADYAQTLTDHGVLASARVLASRRSETLSRAAGSVGRVESPGFASPRAGGRRIRSRRGHR
jgi:transposase-like protein